MDNIFESKKGQQNYSVSYDDASTSTFELIEKNFNQGEKSIAFASTHYKNSQEKCIILTTHFFNKNFPSLKILIVTFNLKNGVFETFVEETEKRETSLKFSDNLFFINWETLVANKVSIKGLVDDYDIVLWDLPELKIITEREEELRPSFLAMDALYIISLKNNNFDDEVFKREIFHFFKDHGLDIRTILPWQLGTKKRKPRLKISKFFYDFFRR